jgi:ABC-type uncharacterized transport system substrate-binding protein
VADLFGRVATHVDRILSGAKLADLLVEPTKLERVLNQHPAQALGLTIPSVLARANDIVE